MKHRFLVILVATALSSCTPAFQEKVHDLSRDGLSLYQGGNYQAARESFQTAFALQPNNFALLYNVGQCSEKLGELPAAEKAYLDCLQRMPDYSTARQALCVVLIKQGRAADARRVVDEWLAFEPGSASAYAADGWYWFQAGDLPRARERYQKALELDGSNLRALTDLGQVFETMGRPDRALALYEKALENHENQPELDKRAKLLRIQGVGQPRPD